MGLPPPSPHPSLDSFLRSHNLSLQPHPAKRRILVTSVFIPAGTILFTSNAIGTVVLDPTACHYCLIRSDQLSTPLTRCSSCKRATYCGKKCQKEDWDAGHATLCKIWKQRGNGGESGDWDKDEEMLVKVLSSLKKGVDTVGIEAFLSLQGHEEVLNEIDKSEWAKIIQGVLKFPKMPASTTSQDLFSHLLRFRSNNFSIHDGELFVIGEGTFPLGALLNHSCHPNCSVLYEGREQVVRTIRDVHAGEELLGTYVDGMGERGERQQTLWSKYGFECDCERCAQGGVDALLGVEGPMSVSEEKAVGEWLEVELRKPITGLLESLYPVFFPANGGQLATPMIPTTLNTLDTFILTVFSHVPPSLASSPEEIWNSRHASLLQMIQSLPDPSPLPRLHTRRLFTHVSRHLHTHLHSPEPSARLALYVLCMYIISYERFHPMIGVQFVLAAKLCWNEGGESGKTGVVIKELCRCAARVVKCTHGNVGGVLKDIEEVLKIVEGAVSNNEPLVGM
ncbi:uncharacterized protein SPPG_00764 [Spizellomyces punctatus DAOM BR117]|uniref:MYND-type domain-containing protein n=1 Tax=Spizellomyces punctatus (strain DAOM BR117) TaxID=645134 RepID=A0A0L0HW21_SPIPD|nr:uncharacterized protein SPPG_00764 [Spizellomyces punctatus DAOM BR117]KND05090.1 hypothetical protein SPPG_00764 [Spizellomyces punctatus DAOM BR117]|eukprot:XP_016613129.1 hypothetical protein SPPG_00764 [Spizellomyces punctatus DAOM BR117]